jgi:hypothetical protein
VTNLERELKNHVVNKDRNKQILSRWWRLNHDRGAGLQARTERQRRINHQRENLEQRHVGSSGIENKVTDGKTKPEKRKQINREVRKSTARSGLWRKRKSCVKTVHFNRYDAVNRSRQERDSTAGKTKEQKSQHGHTEADR